MADYFKRPRSHEGWLTPLQWAFEVKVQHMKFIVSRGYTREETKRLLVPLAQTCREWMTQQLLHDATLLKCECGRDVGDCVKPYCQTYTLLTFPQPLDKIVEV